jgi:hypothetical protein
MDSYAQWAKQDQIDTAATPKDKTVTEMTFDELQRYCSLGLRHQEFNPNQDALMPLLQRVGERVQVFFHNFSDTSSKENVSLQRLGHSGFVLSSTSREFNYLTLYRPSGNKPFLEEYRADKNFRPIEQNAIEGYVITSGYIGCILHFHPWFHPLSEFRYLGKQTSDSRAHVIAFAHKNEVQDLLIGFTDAKSGKSAQLPVQGIAWVDPGTYQILRLYTNLRSTGKLSSLTSQTTNIKFSLVRFDNSRDQMWMPSDIVVSTTIYDNTFRSHHRYSGYRLFTVNSDVKIEKPKSGNRGIPRSRTMP